MLQNSLDRILKLMKDSFRDIWTDELLIEATRAATEAATADMLPQGIAALGNIPILLLYNARQLRG